MKSWTIISGDSPLDLRTQGLQNSRPGTETAWTAIIEPLYKENRENREILLRRRSRGSRESGVLARCAKSLARWRLEQGVLDRGGPSHRGRPEEVTHRSTEVNPGGCRGTIPPGSRPVLRSGDRGVDFESSCARCQRLEPLLTVWHWLCRGSIRGGDHGAYAQRDCRGDFIEFNVGHNAEFLDESQFRDQRQRAVASGSSAPIDGSNRTCQISPRFG